MKKYTVIMVAALILGFLVGVYLYKTNYKKNNNEEMKYGVSNVTVAKWKKLFRAYMKEYLR